MEKEYKLVSQPQRKLNSTMKEIVKVEVMKLLKAGMIYTISNSAFVSLVQVVPKKGLETMLNRCVETNLVLNCEKFNFMVTEGIVLGHNISARRLEVVQAKVEVIEKLTISANVKGICSFHGYDGF
ncbi:PREDICTED: uncharacterized protein LOC109347043 [Lupinus angustifolius]|uniref:uncharacterized protein LOC109347043 n=1 Tax=Lupinus angustifolius TaxID=3871 RepID=UPI00092E7B1D|nr:PREDICTED: uncharacterized protein LOC109347043 [Lupinus angustifolius]